jgi:hypothetical protein
LTVQLIHHLTFLTSEQNLKFMKLNSGQLVLLLSSIWSQASLEDNSPSNFEAMCHTYNIALLCSKAKVSQVLCYTLCYSIGKKIIYGVANREICSYHRF